jgi:WXG100 family type VII secretion target
MALRTTPQSAGGTSGLATGVGFSTQLPVMDSARAYVEHVGALMVTQVNTMLTQLEALNPSTWSGEAAAAFAQAKSQWVSAHQHLTKALNDIAMGLDNSRKTYNQADLDSQLGIVNSVRGLSL